MADFSVTLPSGEMAIIAPTECRDNPAVSAYLGKLLTQETPIKAVHYMDVKQSMRNGGGPACLRLRVVLNEAEWRAVNPSVMISTQIFTVLNQWVERWYRDRLTQADLVDPQLLRDGYDALDELTQILGLGSVYYFQQ